MGLELIKLKAKGKIKVYCFEVKTSGYFLDWERASLGEEQVKKYIKDNLFPKDKFYSGEDLLTDIHSNGTIKIGVEKEETAEYLRDMFLELV